MLISTTISLLLITCILTPLYLAFPDIYTYELMIFDNSMNLAFLVDILVTFNSAYVNHDYYLIDDRKVCFQYHIALDYRCHLPQILVHSRLLSLDTLRSNYRWIKCEQTS